MDLKTTIEISIRCVDLKSIDLFSKCNCVAQILYSDVALGKDVWKSLGVTEIQRSTNSPVFKKLFTVDEFQPFKCELYDIKNPEDVTGKIEDPTEKRVITTAEFSLTELFNNRSRTVVREIVSTKEKKEGEIVVSGDEIKATVDQEVVVDLEGRDLKSGQTYSFIFYRFMNNKVDKRGVYESPKVKCSHKKVGWVAFKLTTRQLGDIQNSFYHISVFAGEKNPKNVGGFDLTFMDLMARNLLSDEKTGKVKRGFVSIQYRLKPRKLSFLERLREGTEISLLCAIDFTKSNGDPKSKYSLHYVQTPEKVQEDGMVIENDYIRSILSLGEIISWYDRSKVFPTFGFGGIVKGKKKTSHCFSISNVLSTVHPIGTQAIIQQYKAVIPKIKFSSPTYVSTVIRKIVSKHGKSAFDLGWVRKYLVVLILTDGVIDDMEKTKKEIENARKYPISFIFVGIGKEDFSKMIELDKYFSTMAEKDDGSKLGRSCFQFICFENVKSMSNTQVARICLDKIPRHVVDFFDYLDENRYRLAEEEKNKLERKQKREIKKRNEAERKRVEEFERKKLKKMKKHVRMMSTMKEIKKVKKKPKVRISPNMPQLIHLVLHDKIDAICQLLDSRGVNVDVDYDGKTALYYAAVCDNAEIFKLLLNYNASVKPIMSIGKELSIKVLKCLFVYEKYQSKILGACFKRSIIEKDSDFLEFLLKSVKNPDIVNKLHEKINNKVNEKYIVMSVFSYMEKNERKLLKFVKVLFKNRYCDTHIKTKMFKTSLLMKLYSVSEYIITFKLSPFSKIYFGKDRNILHYCARSDKMAGVVKKLMKSKEKRVLRKLTDSRGNTPLAIAAKYNAKKNFWLILKGTNTKEIFASKSTRTVLYYLLSNRDYSNAAKLLENDEKGDFVNKKIEMKKFNKDENLQTYPLFVVLDIESRTLLQLLCKHNVNMNQKLNGLRPIEYCFHHKLNKMIEPLIASGANYQQKIKNYPNVVEFCAKHGLVKAVSKFLEVAVHKSRIHHKNKNGRNPLCIAAKRGNGEIVIKLQALQCDSMCVDKTGKIALSYACGNKDLEIVKILAIFSQKFLISCSDPSVHPLTIAVKKNSFKIVKYLLDFKINETCAKRALEMAVEEGNFKIYTLLKRSKNLSFFVKSRIGPKISVFKVMKSFVRNKHESLQILNDLRKNKMLKMSESSKKLNVLLKCSKLGLFQLVKFLLKHKLSNVFFETDEEGRTCFYYAVKNKRKKIISFLIRKYPNILLRSPLELIMSIDKTHFLSEIEYLRGKVHQEREVENNILSISFVKCHASNVDKCDVLGKSDPYFVIRKGNFEVFRSPIIKFTLNPNWISNQGEKLKTLVINSNESHLSFPKEMFELWVYDYDKLSSDDLIGTFEFSFEQVLNGQHDFEIINEEKRAKKKYVNSGVFSMDISVKCETRIEENRKLKSIEEVLVFVKGIYK